MSSTSHSTGEKAINNHSKDDKSRVTQRSRSRGDSRVRDQSNCKSPSTQETKKLPPIKAPVGVAKGPDLKNVTSKIGSLQNVKHKPAGNGGKAEAGVKVVTQKLEWKAKPRIGSLDNAKHKPGGGDVKVENKKLEWKVTSKIGSLDNVKHKPGGGAVKIFDEKYHQRSSSSVRSPSLNARCVSPSSLKSENIHDKEKMTTIEKGNNQNSKGTQKIMNRE